MKRIILFPFLVLFVLCSCKEDSVSPKVETVEISVRYNRPDKTFVNGYEYYSPVASITWSGGNTTVANQSQSTKISVPKGATLTGTYSRTFKSYSGSAYDKFTNYKETLTADANKSWTL
jgi:hypothetical protein